MPIAQITGLDSPSTKFTDSNTLLGDLTSQLLLYAVSISGIVFFVMLVLGGFGYLTAAGDSGKISSSTKTIVNSLVGLVATVSTFFIAQIVSAVFGLKLL